MISKRGTMPQRPANITDLLGIGLGALWRAWQSTIHLRPLRFNGSCLSRSFTAGSWHGRSERNGRIALLSLIASCGKGEALHQIRRARTGLGEDQPNATFTVAPWCAGQKCAGQRVISKDFVIKSIPYWSGNGILGHLRRTTHGLPLRQNSAVNFSFFGAASLTVGPPIRSRKVAAIRRPLTKSLSFTIGI